MELVETTNILGIPQWGARSISLVELAKALSKAQGAIDSVKKDTINPFFKSKYADLASVREATREPLALNGLSVIQEPSTVDGRVRIATTLLHTSGEYIRSELEMPVAKQDAQGIGSVISYARRYALQAILCIAPEIDDDANEGTGNVSTATDFNKQHNIKSADEIHKGQQSFIDDRPAMDADFNPNEKLWFGKHKGKTWTEVDQSYLDWLAKQENPKTRAKALAETARRKLEGGIDKSFSQELPPAWEDDQIPNWENQ